MPARTERRANGLRILTGAHASVRALRRAGHVAEIHGNKLWNSSFLLMEHLKKHPLPAGTRVLEIGCGWGLLSIFCAKRFGAVAHGIDADANVQPYMHLHAELNGVEVTSEKKTFAQLTTKMLADYDLVVGGDICFWDDLNRDLFNLIRRARKAGVGTVMIADPCRPPFTALAERCEATLPNTERRTVHLSRPVKASGQILIVR
ncbi:MAG: methyltransferase domain-containing protein [Pseudomonadota bacterium]|nr:methyltransferase domain-containing protein [Pseudomonadota bacterium]